MCTCSIPNSVSRHVHWGLSVRSDKEREPDPGIIRKVTRVWNKAKISEIRDTIALMMHNKNTPIAKQDVQVNKSPLILSAEEQNEGFTWEDDIFPSVTDRYHCWGRWIGGVWYGRMALSYEVNVNRHSGLPAWVVHLGQQWHWHLTLTEIKKKPSVQGLMIKAGSDDSATLYFAVAISRKKSGRSLLWLSSLCREHIQWQHSDEAQQQMWGNLQLQINICCGTKSQWPWINVPSLRV